MGDFSYSHWSLLAFVETFLSRWEWSLSGWLLPSLNECWWEWKSCKSYATAFRVNKSPTTEHLWEILDLFWTACFIIIILIKTPSGKYISKCGVHPTSIVSVTGSFYTKTHWSCSSASWWPIPKSLVLMLFFSALIHVQWKESTMKGRQSW